MPLLENTTYGLNAIKNQTNNLKSYNPRTILIDWYQYSSGEYKIIDVTGEGTLSDFYWLSESRPYSSGWQYELIVDGVTLISYNDCSRVSIAYNNRGYVHSLPLEFHQNSGSDGFYILSYLTDTTITSNLAILNFNKSLILKLKKTKVGRDYVKGKITLK